MLSLSYGKIITYPKGYNVVNIFANIIYKCIAGQLYHIILYRFLSINYPFIMPWHYSLSCHFGLMFYCSIYLIIFCHIIKPERCLAMWTSGVVQNCTMQNICVYVLAYTFALSEHKVLPYFMSHCFIYFILKNLTFVITCIHQFY